MSFSLSVRKAAVCWCSVVAIPAVVFSQNSFVPNGGEYSISGKIPGDQVHPQLNITTNGGYIVWEDNWIDGSGLGVGAMRLKNDLTGTGVPFKVNSLPAGDQESAQVTLLNDGGAAFAWQGGREGFEHIYSRFLSSSNNWVTGDVLVNSATNVYQSSPVMATLLNGNVAIAYVSYGQAANGSMADVYLQMFSPSGNKLGGEVLVNQFTANNQRTPTIAALANGNFLVGWVSEQERWTDVSNGVPSVDIYARTFDSTGSPLGGEFLVNVSSNVCAMPNFTAVADGGFLAVWGERDLVVNGNGWDVYARRFTAADVGGNVTRVNTQLFGDQLAPKVSRNGTNYLAVWTSMGQDGSKEGVFGSYLNDDATTSGSEFQVNTTTLGSQMHQAVAADGVGRFLTAWTSFNPGLAGFDLYGQQYANPALAVIGTNNLAFNTDPNANPNSVSNTIPTTPVILPPGGGSNQGNVGGALLSFADVKGTYNGLVYDSAGVTTANSGYITITTSAKGDTGSFSAKLQMGGAKYSFSGAFDATGAYTGKVGSLTVTLQIDLTGGNQITGQISNGNWTAQVQANRVVFGKTNVTPLAGSYTMVIQPTDGTMGNGVGTVTVDNFGNVKWSLVLPDGTKVSQSTTLSKNGAWPLYAQPYKTGGVAVGWMQFDGAATDGFGGQCVWVKPAGAGAPYAGGLTNGVTISGAQFKTPPVGFRTFGNSTVVFSGGGLSSPLTNSVMWGIDNKIASLSGKSLKLNLNPSSGLFQGTVVIGSGKGSTVSFQGVLFEKNNVGLGIFIGGNQSGTVSFAPNN